jgi:hypothetical protein
MTGFEHGNARTILVMCQEQRTGMVQEQRGNQNGIREKSQRVNSCTSTSFSHAQHLTQRKNAKAPVQKVPENDRLGQICRCSVPSILDPRGIAIEPIFNKPKQKQIH